VACEWLSKLFPAKRNQVSVLIEDSIPSWTSADAEVLHNFLGCTTGVKFLKRIKYGIAQKLLDPALTEDERLLTCAAAQFLDGVESSADIKFWRGQEADTFDEEEAYRYLDDPDKDAE